MTDSAFISAEQLLRHSARQIERILTETERLTPGELKLEHVTAFGSWGTSHEIILKSEISGASS